MYKKKILNKISKYCLNNYVKLNKEDMILGECYYNFRCHINSVQKVKEGKAENVFLCVSIFEDEPVVHFINRNKDGKFIDHTWGWTYELRDYYLIREIDSSEYNKIWNVLVDTKKDLISKNSNKILRNIFMTKEDFI